SQPKRRHGDEHTVVGLEGDPQVELEDTIRSKERPVRAAVQYLSAQPRTLEVAAADRRNHTRAQGNGADLFGRADFHFQSHERTRVHRGRLRRTLSHWRRDDAAAHGAVSGGWHPAPERNELRSQCIAGCAPASAKRPGNPKLYVSKIFTSGWTVIPAALI